MRLNLVLYNILAQKRTEMFGPADLISAWHEGGVAKSTIVSGAATRNADCKQPPLPRYVKLLTLQDLTFLSVICFSKLRFREELRRRVFFDWPRFF